MTDRNANVMIGWTIAISWVVASLIAAVTGRGLAPEEQPAVKYYALGLHAFSRGPFVVHLFAYSFIHGIGAHLLFNLLALWIVVRLAQGHVTPAGLVRLYSLGSLATGLIYVLVSWRLNNHMPLIGAGGPLMAVIGAMAVLNPSKEMALYAGVNGVFQLLGLASSPNLALGMIAGLIAGLLYGCVERLVMAWNVR